MKILSLYAVIIFLKHKNRCSGHAMTVYSDHSCQALKSAKNTKNIFIKPLVYLYSKSSTIALSKGTETEIKPSFHP